MMGKVREPEGGMGCSQRRRRSAHDGEDGVPERKKKAKLVLLSYLWPY
jgi:hypothetical protein